MRVILTDDVVGVGDIGESIKVKSGYARNFLIPRKLAIETGSATAREIAHKMKQIELKKKKMKSVAEAQGERLVGTSVGLELRVGSGGKVFGSVSARDIAEKLNNKGYELDRRRVLLFEPLKKIGRHTVRVKLHAEVLIDIAVIIKPVAADAEQEDKETKEAKESIEQKSEKRKPKGQGKKRASELSSENNKSAEE